MNNRQTNRRRGRGNNNRAPNNNRNGFDNANRIDNRARGNASQMLEKYKKLAQDAQHNGDRVNAEYYLQFADHYFRVLADFRSRQEEGRPQREWRNDEREAGEDWREEERETAEEGEETEIVAEAGHEEEDDRRPQRREREPREERGSRAERGERPDRSERNARGRSNNRRDRNENREERVAPEDAGLDLSILPPSIAIANDANDAEEVEEVVEAAVEKPARKPRTRRPKSANDEEVVTAAE
jgi:hypothetical protein